MTQETREELYEQCTHMVQATTFMPDRAKRECPIVRVECVACGEDLDHPLKKAAA
jgi:hypothetical protein